MWLSDESCFERAERRCFRGAIVRPNEWLSTKHAVFDPSLGGSAAGWVGRAHVEPGAQGRSVGNRIPRTKKLEIEVKSMSRSRLQKVAAGRMSVRKMKGIIDQCSRRGGCNAAINYYRGGFSREIEPLCFSTAQKGRPVGQS